MTTGDRTIAYTDGACSGNPGPGGWAWAVPDGPFASGASPSTTNQRMELTAALEAVRANAGPLEVVSDSTYVVNCFRDRWWEGWIKRGWTTSARKPVANRDLWEPLVELVRSRGDVVFRWVKGHGGDAMNDLVDRLAVEATTTQVGRHGDRPPTEVGPPDRPGRRRGSRAASATGTGADGVPAGSGGTTAGEPGAGAAGSSGRRDGRLPDGWLVVVAGHRPPELGGYDPNPVAAGVATRLGEALAALRDLHPDLTVLSGLRLGAELLGARAALDLGLPLVAVLPYPEPDRPWPAESRRRFAEVVGAAERTITLDGREPSSKQAAGMALARRDAWLARNADGAVLVWDGEDDLVGRLVRSFEDHLGDEGVLLVRP
ncbi:MAG: RNase H family protein [Acidimicrobiia bacterium]